jgi:UDP-N-acetylmuramate dehydrogenase
VGEFVEAVDVLSGGVERSLARPDIAFSYRHSGLGERGDIVLGAVFILPARERAEILSRMRSFLDRRKEQPGAWKNAGCMFKNPEGDSAGALVDRAGLKGVRAGGMEISPRHANFINNLGGGTAADALELMSRMRREVHSRFGVMLEPEVRVIDEWGRPAVPGAGA